MALYGDAQALQAPDPPDAAPDVEGTDEDDSDFELDLDAMVAHAEVADLLQGGVRLFGRTDLIHCPVWPATGQMLDGESGMLLELRPTTSCGLPASPVQQPGCLPHETGRMWRYRLCAAGSFISAIRLKMQDAPHVPQG